VEPPLAAITEFLRKGVRIILCTKTPATASSRAKDRSIGAAKDERIEMERPSA